MAAHPMAIVCSWKAQAISSSLGGAERVRQAGKMDTFKCQELRSVWLSLLARKHY